MTQRTFLDRATLAVPWGAAATLVAYGVVRVVEVRTGTGVPPTEILLTEHSAYFARIGASLAFGVTAAVAVDAIADRHAGACRRLLPTALAVAATAIVLTASIVP
ncbi:MAG: hypothetical protein U0169_16365 [Polyangiaceae bacterium]